MKVSYIEHPMTFMFMYIFHIDRLTFYKYNNFIKLYVILLIFQRVKKVLKSPETAQIFMNVNDRLDHGEYFNCIF